MVGPIAKNASFNIVRRAVSHECIFLYACWLVLVFSMRSMWQTILFETNFSTTLLRKGILATGRYDDMLSGSSLPFLYNGLITDILRADGKPSVRILLARDVIITRVGTWSNSQIESLTSFCVASSKWYRVTLCETESSTDEISFDTIVIEDVERWTRRILSVKNVRKSWASFLYGISWGKTVGLIRPHSCFHHNLEFMPHFSIKDFKLFFFTNNCLMMIFTSLLVTLSMLGKFSCPP